MIHVFVSSWRIQEHPRGQGFRERVRTLHYKARGYREAEYVLDRAGQKDALDRLAHNQQQDYRLLLLLRRDSFLDKEL